MNKKRICLIWGISIISALLLFCGCGKKEEITENTDVEEVTENG